MMRISELKDQFPQYEGVPLDEFAYRLWQKKYSNRIPWQAFQEQTQLGADIAATETSSIGSLLAGAGKFYRDIGDFLGITKPDPQGRAAYNVLAQQHPVATMAGEMAPTLAIPGAGPGSGALRAIGTEAAIGAGLGAVNPEQGALEGAAYGAVGGTVGRALSRVFGGAGGAAAAARPSGEHAALVSEAQRLGYRLTPGEAMGDVGGEIPRKLVRRAEEAVAGNVYLGGPFAAQAARNQQVTQRIAREAIGLTGDGPLTDDVLLDASHKIGSGLQDVFGKQDIPLDDTFLQQLGELEHRVGPSVTRDDRWSRYLSNALDLAEEKTVSPEDLQQLVSDIAGSARAASRGDNPHYQLARGLYSMREVFDDALIRAAPDPAAKATLADLRNQYRILKVLESPGVIRSGEVSLPSLRRVLKSKAGGRFREGSPIGRAASVGDYFKQITPNSGTPTRQFGQDLTDTVAQLTRDPTGGLLNLGTKAAVGVLPWAYLHGASPQGMFNLAPGARGALGEGLTRLGGRTGANLAPASPVNPVPAAPLGGVAPAQADYSARGQFGAQLPKDIVEPLAGADWFQKWWSDVPPADRRDLASYKRRLSFISTGQTLTKTQQTAKKRLLDYLNQMEKFQR